MTTIAYKDGVIAYDSRICADITIVDDDFNKCVEFDDLIFVFAGCPSDFDKFIQYFRAGKNLFGDAAIDVPDICCFVVERSTATLYKSSISTEGKFWKEELRKDFWYAIGSGGDHALTAMDMGASSEEAVKITMKRDSRSGGTIRVFDIRRLK